MWFLFGSTGLPVHEWSTLLRTVRVQRTTGMMGEVVVEHTDVILRSTDFPEMKINQFLMAPYFGPGLLPHAQKLWIDELAVGIKRIGPLL